MDRLLFGDNQFFGVNHMSEEKARAQAMRFQDIQAVIEVLDNLLNVLKSRNLMHFLRINLTLCLFLSMQIVSLSTFGTTSTKS